MFDALKLGDSIIKLKNSDSIKFFTSSGLMYDDYNKYIRESYLKTIN